MKLYFTEETAGQILACKKSEVEISLDLGKSSAKVSKRFFRTIPLEKVRGDFIYLWDGSALFKLAIAAEHYYKLRVFKGIPVLEIDGLRMQLVKDFRSPLDYPQEIARRLGIARGTYVLDTCAGLGYTAIAAYRQWAKVLSFEKDPNVLEIAKENPWSAELFKGKEIELREADVLQEIVKIPDKSFDSIIHDPPRFSLAGELYSGEFYAQLFRVAKKGAKLFHYVGSVGKKSGKSIEAGVIERLRAARWKRIRYDKRMQGVFAQKA